MHLFSNHVLSKDEAEKTVVKYIPQKFPFEVPQPATEFNQMQEARPTAFRMNEIIAARTGIADKQKQEKEELAELMALEKLKEIQETAYKEAHDLGMVEGRKEAFAKYENEIIEGVQNLNELISSISKLKTELLTFNESHIVKLLYYMASRLAMKEIQEDAEAIVPVLRTVLESSQEEESLTVKVSAEDFEFLNESQRFLNLKIQALKRAKIEKVEAVKRGGCVIETNYGQVDATLEHRMSRLWETVSETAPKAKDRFES
jgi:flagellar assembly protein FliH